MRAPIHCFHAAKANRPARPAVTTPQVRYGQLPLQGTGYFTGVKSLCQERDRKGDSPFGEEGLPLMSRSISSPWKGK